MSDQRYCWPSLGEPCGSCHRCFEPAFTIYEKHPTLDAYRVGPSYTPYAIVAVNKRFTEGDMAAEYWRTAQDIAYIVEGITWEGMCDGWSIDEDDALDRLAILDRFAIANHFDE